MGVAIALSFKKIMKANFAMNSTEDVVIGKIVQFINGRYLICYDENYQNLASFSKERLETIVGETDIPLGKKIVLRYTKDRLKTESCLVNNQRGVQLTPVNEFKISKEFEINLDSKLISDESSTGSYCQ